MKKYIFILSAAAMLFASCTLDEESKVEVPMDFVDNTEKAEQVLLVAVTYTHMTLPTILRV